MNTLYPVDLFPFTDLPETDEETRTTGSLLARATAAHVVPKIFYTNGSYEYWSRAAALIHVSPDGTSDAPLPPTTRIYYFAGSQHSPAGFPPQRLGAPENRVTPIRTLSVCERCWSPWTIGCAMEHYRLLRDIP